MPQIPLGEFGFRTAQPGQFSTVVPDIQVPANQGVARGLQQLGEGGLQLAVAEQERIAAEQRRQEFELRKQRTAQLQDTLGKATEELQLLEETHTRADQDWRTAPNRFQEESAALAKRYAEGLTDSTTRAAFEGQFRKLQLQKSINVRKDAFGKERDYNRASLDSNLDVYANAAAGAKTPEEQGFITEQAGLAIAAMRHGGWVNEVEAGERERKFRAKIDTVTVLRDLQAQPEIAAQRLIADPTYLPNLDEVQRQRYVDMGLRQAESHRSRADREEEKRARKRSDEVLSDAYKDLADGKLTRKRADDMRHLVSPAEYRGLLEALKHQASAGAGGPAVDNRASFAELQVALLERPDEAKQLALQLHRERKISDGTLSSVFTRLGSAERREGPKSPYERSRGFIATSLDPGPMSMDPAPKARMGMAIKDFDDWFEAQRRSSGKDPADKEVNDKAQELIGRYSMVNMNEIVRKTGVGSRNQPERTLQDLQSEVGKLMQDRKDGKITQQTYNRRMKELDEVRTRAEGANRGR